MEDRLYIKPSVLQLEFSTDQAVAQSGNCKSDSNADGKIGFTSGSCANAGFTGNSCSSAPTGAS